MSSSHWAKPFIFVVPVLIALVVGLLLPVSHLRDEVWKLVSVNASSKDDANSEHGDDHNHGEHVVMSETVRRSLGVRIGPLIMDDYTAHYEIHAFVRELPGATDMRLSSRFSGIVTKVHVSQGEFVREGDPLCQLELTGQEIATAQSELLQTISQKEIVDLEIARLQPLVEGGSVPGRRVLELQYESSRHQARLAALEQELLIRGLTGEQINSIQSTRNLIKEVTVFVPSDFMPPQLNSATFDDFERRYYLERVIAKPGRHVSAGDDLFLFAYHDTLVVEGHAFEKDLPTLRQLVHDKQPVAISIGPEIDEIQIQDQMIAFISSHATEETNAFPFFIYLNNRPDPETASFTSTSTQTPSKTTATLGGLWKPGQRAHVYIPFRIFKNKYVLPRDAVVNDGVRNLLFKWSLEAHDHDHAHDDHEHYEEFEPVEVHLLHTDRQFVVIEPSSKLKEGTRIAMSKAQNLLFAMQMSSGGGGHDHGHDH